ncbi:MAG: hypothetical protein ACI822_002596 [Gammaproteobacteria bacterium]|jgi:hypothetical protein
MNCNLKIERKVVAAGFSSDHIIEWLAFARKNCATIAVIAITHCRWIYVEQDEFFDKVNR